MIPGIVASIPQVAGGGIETLRPDGIDSYDSWYDSALGPGNPPLATNVDEDLGSLDSLSNFVLYSTTLTREHTYTMGNTAIGSVTYSQSKIRIVAGQISAFADDMYVDLYMAGDVSSKGRVTIQPDINGNSTILELTHAGWNQAWTETEMNGARIQITSGLAGAKPRSMSVRALELVNTY